LLAEHGDELKACAFDQAANNHHSARGDRRAAVWNQAGIGRGHRDVVVVDADGFGRNLREHGICALAEFSVRHQYAHLALRRNVDAGQRIQDAFAGTREAGAVIEAGDADAALDGTGWILRAKRARGGHDSRSL
jgi:hypothetical protein